MEEDIIFCKSGGCTAKLGPGLLGSVLSKLPSFDDPNLLVGFESLDDAAVYQLTDDLAIVQTLDFFPPMVEDPYVFGQIAAANALSDIYAMGGEVKTALNIVCYPENMNLNILGKILLGGSEKVKEAGGVLSGGHSIVDEGIKYGLSVTGIIHPKKIYKNNSCHIGDYLILTKPLGVGIVSTAHRVGEDKMNAMAQAIRSMTLLNKYGAQIIRKYEVHACTDVTGFGFLGHLHEMVQSSYSFLIHTKKLPIIEHAFAYAEEFFITAAGQRNRKYLQEYIHFEEVGFGMEEILFDPQTSGGLLVSLSKEEAIKACIELKQKGLHAEIVGEVISREHHEIIVI
ncbi:selenide, water dikinase SelD [Niameybacter sp.]|uniref:selenide, water dikinase SelD n=1 Tax=Niameybacter sp. TaxID=2033640 RepID=UPI002FC7A3E0